MDNAKAFATERDRQTRAPGIGTLLIAIAVMVFTAAVVSVATYGVMVALRLTGSEPPVFGNLNASAASSNAFAKAAMRSW